MACRDKQACADILLSGGLLSACRESGILEALPDRLDPAGAGGPVALPAAGATMHGVR